MRIGGRNRTLDGSSEGNQSLRQRGEDLRSRDTEQAGVAWRHQWLLLGEVRALMEEAW